MRYGRTGQALVPVVLAILLVLSGRVLCTPLNMSCCAPAEVVSQASSCCHHEPASDPIPKGPSRECSCDIHAPSPLPPVDFETPHLTLPFKAPPPSEVVLHTHGNKIPLESMFHGPPYSLPRLISLRI
ncbi:MAG: hypothetical protein AB7F75_02795 [Planctomycetota bacterium]